MKTLLSKKALFFCAVLAVFCFIIIFLPLTEFKISRFLANLTQQIVITQINPVRQSYGLIELQTNEKLNQAAQLKAEDMIARNYFSHKDPDGQTPWVWLEQVGYNYSTAGENLAMDVSDPEVLKNAWLNSPSHAKNILNSAFTDIGVGVAKGKISGKKTIVVVMFLGKEAGVEPAKVASKPVSAISRFISLFLISFLRLLP